MKVLVGSSDMGGFPWLYPFEPAKDDPRRAIEVPTNLYERLVEAHEEFCAVLAEVDVQCVELLDAPDPCPAWLEYGRTDDGDKKDVYIARCARDGCQTVAAIPRQGWDDEGHERAVAEVLALGWRERRHGGLSCPTHAPTEVLLEPHEPLSQATGDKDTGG